MPGLPPGGIMPIMGAPGIGRPPGGMPGMLGCPLGLLAMFIVPNMNCCGGTPAPALAITFFSSPSLPPPFARGCGTPCPLCGGGVDMTHFPLFSIHATLLRVRSLSQSKNASPSSVTQSLASTTSDPFHHPRATPRAARARTRPARAIPSSSVLGPVVARRSPTRSSLSRFPTLRTRHRRPPFARPRAFDARSPSSSPSRRPRASRRRAHPSSSRSIRLGRPAAVRVRRAVSDRLCRPRGASSRRGRGEVGRAGSGSPSRSPHAPSF